MVEKKQGQCILRSLRADCDAAICAPVRKPNEAPSVIQQMFTESLLSAESMVNNTIWVLASQSPKSYGHERKLI